MQNAPLNNYQQNPIQQSQAQCAPCTPVQPVAVNNVPQQPQVPIQPAVNYDANSQNLQVPNYSGVNIQIFNPSVGTPGGAPVYNVNAPNYGTQPCYPQGYYTNAWGQGSNTNNAKDANNSNLNNSSSDLKNENISSINTTNTTVKDEKKTVKKEIVQLTDPYIKSLENYLNSQDKEIRMMGAKQVAERLQEDKSRRDDKALTALINKMLQDPYQPVRFLALTMLNGRYCTGDEYTMQVLQNMQQSSSGYGQDALQASEVLLKMAGEPVKKEFKEEDLYPEQLKKGK